MSWRHKSYDEVPALSIRRDPLRRALRVVTVAWMFGVVWQSLCAGSRVTLFARALGFTDFDFGLLASIPYIATLGQLVSSILIERTGLTKHQFLQFATVHRLLWLVIAAIPLAAIALGVDLPSRVAVYTMLIVLTASAFLVALAGPAWMTWMGDLIPRRIRGRYMANRGRIATIIKVPIVIGLGVLLDALTVRDAGGEPLEMTFAAQPALLWTICGVFVFAAFMGAIDILVFHHVREVLPTVSDEPREPAIRLDPLPLESGLSARVARAGRYMAVAGRQLLVEPLADRVFRRYVMYGVVVTFASTVGSQYMWLYLLEDLRFSQVATDGLFLVLGPIVVVFSARVWGRLIDRWGRRPVMFIGSILTVGSVSPYFFAVPGLPNPQWLIDAVNAVWLAAGGSGASMLTSQTPVTAWLIMCVSMFLGGIGWGGIMLAQQSVILGFADGTGRSKYVAAHGVLISIGGLVGGVVGGLAARHFAFMRRDAPIVLGPLMWHNWHVTFFLSMLARIAGVILAATMPDPGSAPMRHVARYVTASVYNNVASRLFYVVRIFGWGRDRNDR